MPADKLPGTTPANPLTLLPAGWDVSLRWFNDDYPCVTLTLTRDYGRVKHEAFGHGESLFAALEYAVGDVLVLIARAERTAHEAAHG